MQPAYTIHQQADHYCGRFFAMASPCELLMDGQDPLLAEQLTHAVVQETQRIERKYSRYRTDNLMHHINHSAGQTVAIDEETFRLLTFANTCYDLSDGLFDITSGVLRKAWRFDGSANIPSPAEVEALRPYIGWEQVVYNPTSVCLPIGFELDFGGIGKEYAVQNAAQLCHKLAPDCSVLINFGGDIQVTQPRASLPYWLVGIEDPRQQDSANAILKIAMGGLATSGDARRYLEKNGVRYSHILNPKTGYPILNAPRSVTVAAEHCVQAGLLATLSLLQGDKAGEFLTEQGVTHWIF